MDKEKFRISIIDFLPHHKTVEVGEYQDGTKAYLGDCVEYPVHDEKYIIVYRYGRILLKQIGIWAMIGSNDFDNGDFSSVQKTDIVMAGDDWLIIGYVDCEEDQEMYEKLKEKQLLNKS